MGNLYNYANKFQLDWNLINLKFHEDLFVYVYCIDIGKRSRTTLNASLNHIFQEFILCFEVFEKAMELLEKVP